MSIARERGAMVYVQASAGDAREVLAQIEEVLASLGASKANLLTARVLLPDMDRFAEYDSAWNHWLGKARRPLRVCALNAAALIDIAVTGLRMRASPSRSPHVQGRPAQG